MNVNPQLLMAEVERKRVVRVCSNMLSYEKLTVLLSLDVPKIYKNRESTDRPSDPILSSKMTHTEQIVSAA